VSERALKKLRKRAQQRPQDVAAWYRLGLAALRAGQQQEAAQALQSALQASPSTVDQLIQIGRALDQVDRPREALRAYRAAYDLAPDSTEACGYLGLSLARDGRVEEGVEMLRRACSLCPRDSQPQACVVLASWLIEIGRNEEAAAYLRRALHLSPEHQQARIRLGYCLRATGQIDEALQELRLAATYRPRDLRACIEYAVTLSAAGQHQRATEVLAQVPQAELTASWLLDFALTFRRIGEPATAVRYLRAAIRVDPQSHRAYCLLGETLLDGGLVDAAVDPLERAVTLCPSWAEPHFQLGLALKRQNNVKSAITALAQAATLAPGDNRIETALQELLVRQVNGLSFVQPWPDTKTSEGPSSDVEAAFRGSLDTFTVADLLDFLKVNRRTGTLLLGSDHGMGDVRLFDGKISGASSPRTQQLGDLLVASNLITSEQLQAAMLTQRTTGTDDLLGAMLVQQNMIDQQTLCAVVVRQIESAVSELVCWNKGSFAFEPGRHCHEASRPEPCVQLEVDAVLLEVMRQLDEQNQQVV